MMQTEELFDDSVNSEAIGESFIAPKKGRYLFKVRSYKYNGEKSRHEYRLEVVGGKPADKNEGSQLGRSMVHYLGTDFKDMPRKKRLAFALAAGLVTQQQVDDAAKSRTALMIDWESAVGVIVGANVIEEEYNNELRSKINWPNDVYSRTSRSAFGLTVEVDDDDPFQPADAATNESGGSAEAESGGLFD